MSSRSWLTLEAVGGDIPETQFFEGDSAFSSLGLTRTQRLYGFATCYIVGMVLSILGTSMFITGGGPFTFAILYAIGTVVSLIGTGFLIGFGKQLKLMFKPVRVVATVVFLTAIIIVIVIVIVTATDFAFPTTLGIILYYTFVVVEYLAFLWYALSYIPYARSAVLRVFRLA